MIYGKHNTQSGNTEQNAEVLLPSALRMLSWALGIDIYRQWYWKRGGNKNLILNTDIELGAFGTARVTVKHQVASQSTNPKYRPTSTQGSVIH